VDDVCAFCGYEGDNFDPEHWIPLWLSRKLIPKYGSMVGHVANDGSIVLRRYFEITVPHVCRPCNGGWMSDIETKASSNGEVLRLVLGVTEPPLTRGRQTDLATWCFLKALTAELARPENHTPTYPREMYAQFKRDKRPPRTACSIALGFRTMVATEPDPVFVWSHSQGRNFPIDQRGIDSGASATETGYLTTILIGHLVIDVAGLLRPLDAQLNHGEGFVPFWPELPGKAFAWPPPKRFTGVADDDLV
jgi:hypothetical protein